MTKVIILGEAIPEQAKKPIEFIKFLTNGIPVNTEGKAKEWKNIELISLKYDGRLDLMYAYNNNRNQGVLYFGHFNDGVVE